MGGMLLIEYDSNEDSPDFLEEISVPVILFMYVGGLVAGDYLIVLLSYLALWPFLALRWLRGQLECIKQRRCNGT